MVGVPPVWIRLLKWVARAVLVYIDAVEVAEAEEAEEAEYRETWGTMVVQLRSRAFDGL